MCVCVCVCVFVCVFVCVYVCVYVFVSVFVCECVCEACSLLYVCHSHCFLQFFILILLTLLHDVNEARQQ